MFAVKSIKLLPAASVMTTTFQLDFSHTIPRKGFCRDRILSQEGYTFAYLSDTRRLLQRCDQHNAILCVGSATEVKSYPVRWSRWVRNSSIDPKRIVPSGNSASIEPSE